MSINLVHCATPHFFIQKYLQQPRHFNSVAAVYVNLSLSVHRTDLHLFHFPLEITGRIHRLDAEERGHRGHRGHRGRAVVDRKWSHLPGGRSLPQNGRWVCMTARHWEHRWSALFRRLVQNGIRQQPATHLRREGKEGRKGVGELLPHIESLH